MHHALHQAFAMIYTLKHPPRSKRITLKVEHPDRVIVSAPKKTKLTVIDLFVNQNQPWIESQISKLKSHHQQIESHAQIMIFGKKYQKQQQVLPDISETIIIRDHQLLINLPDSSSRLDVSKEIKNFLKKTARSYLYQRTPQLAKQLGVEYHSLKLKEQKSRWGSCSSKDNLNLNWRLVHYPPAVIDYVIIHELAHLVHPNHSRSFWQYVEAHCPEFKQHRKYLKKFGVTHN